MKSFTTLKFDYLGFFKLHTWIMNDYYMLMHRNICDRYMHIYGHNIFQ